MITGDTEVLVKGRESGPTQPGDRGLVQDVFRAALERELQAERGTPAAARFQEFIAGPARVRGPHAE